LVLDLLDKKWDLMHLNFGNDFEYFLSGLGVNFWSCGKWVPVNDTTQ